MEKIRQVGIQTKKWPTPKYATMINKMTSMRNKKTRSIVDGSCF